MPTQVSGLKLRLFFHQFPQYIVAKKTGINPAVLSCYANGKRAINPRHLMELAAYFNCGADELLEYVITDAFDKVGVS